MGGRLEAWFLAAKFIEAAEVFKTERIKLPAGANIEEDDKCFPPPCLAKLRHGSNEQAVAAALQGQPRRRRINPGILDQNAALTPFGSTGMMKKTICSNKCSDALFREPSKQCELILVLLFLSTRLPKWPKMGEKRP